MIEAGLIFLCMADNVFAARRAFAYLVDIRNLFLSEARPLLLTFLISSMLVGGSMPLLMRWIDSGRL